MSELLTATRGNIFVKWDYSNSIYITETPNLGQNRICFLPCDLEIWRLTLHHIIAIGQFKLELQSGNTKFGCKSTIFVPCDLEFGDDLANNMSYGPKTARFIFHLCDLTYEPWPWPFAWTSPLSVAMTAANFMIIRWQLHCEKGVTGRQTDGRTDRNKCCWSCLVAALKLKNTRQGSLREYRNSPPKYLSCNNIESRNSNCGLPLDYHRNSYSNKLA